MERLTNISTVREILSRHGFTFSKALGQNFLINPSVCPRMAEAAVTDDNTGVLEIGPGIGVLTNELLKRAKKVVAVELDKRLIPVLEETLGEYDNLRVITIYGSEDGVLNMKKVAEWYNTLSKYASLDFLTDEEREQFTNLLNRAWGIYYASAYNRQVLNVTAITRDGKGNATPTYSFYDNTYNTPSLSDFYSRWRCQVGLRFTF